MAGLTPGAGWLGCLLGLLAGLAIVEDRRRNMHPVERCVRWVSVTAFSIVIGYWKGLFG